MHSTKLGQFTVWFNQSEEFHQIRREIFTHNVYYVELEVDQPIIIDAGAHIGLATLYFKRIYPSSRIWAIEPIPENYLLLEKNCTENQLSAVTLINAALTDQGNSATFHLDASTLGWQSTASRFPQAWNGQQQTKPIQVKALQLSRLLTEIDQPIDLLKLDIEGSEFAVLKEARHQLKQVRQMLIEFHPRTDQQIEELEQFFDNCGFELDFWQHGRTIDPHKAKGLFYIQAIYR